MKKIVAVSSFTHHLAEKELWFQAWMVDTITRHLDGR